MGPGDRQSASLPCAARSALRVSRVHWPRPAADAGRPRASTLLKNEPKGFKVGALGANLGALGSNLGALGSNLAALGANLGARGSNLEALGSNLGALGSNLGALGRVQELLTPLKSPSPRLAAAWARRPATRRTWNVDSSLMSTRKDETALGFRIAPWAYRPATAGGGTPAASAKGARAPKAMRRKRRSSRRPMPAAACSAGAWRPLAPLAPDDRSGGSGSAGGTSGHSAWHNTRYQRLACLHATGLPRASFAGGRESLHAASAGWGCPPQLLRDRARRATSSARAGGLCARTGARRWEARRLLLVRDEDTELEKL